MQRLKVRVLGRGKLKDGEVEGDKTMAVCGLWDEGEKRMVEVQI
jgi:hypothetical protein